MDAHRKGRLRAVFLLVVLAQVGAGTAAWLMSRGSRAFSLKYLPRQCLISLAMAGIDIRFNEIACDESSQELCRQYWQLGQSGKFVNSLAQLAAAFNIPKHQVAAVVARYCKAFSRDDLCRSCGVPKRYTRRSDYEQHSRTAAWTSWTCEDCVALAREEAERERARQDSLRRELVQKELDERRTHGLEPRQLSFTQAVYVLSVLRAGGSEDFEYVAPRNSVDVQLSPTVDLDREIFDELYTGRVLCIHPGSKPESIVIEKGEFRRFFIFQVHWTLPLPIGGRSPARFVEELENVLKGDDWPELWEENAAELHRRVALHECIQYLRLCMEDHGFAVNVGEKTLLTLRAALTRFSIAQVYNFIWGAARDAAAFYVRSATSKSHAANIVPGAIQREAERAIAEGWPVKEYRRDRRAPESTLTQVLFTTALKLPEGGFTTVPPAPSNG